ncbi:hypothetical protein BJ970_004276 [Saccharopolyspora phatthalungensis]|uniref:Uncharacterized protein n=1 Tax=Saccharopolyspora phatthalungensis TaxID=664693 RepID=A0A840Q2J6_9PSEU|nr:hypothetical protein [Saccharopolyspora phatthalungensis]
MIVVTGIGADHEGWRARRRRALPDGSASRIVGVVAVHWIACLSLDEVCGSAVRNGGVRDGSGPKRQRTGG